MINYIVKSVYKFKIELINGFYNVQLLKHIKFDVFLINIYKYKFY